MNRHGDQKKATPRFTLRPAAVTFGLAFGAYKAHEGLYNHIHQFGYGNGGLFDVYAHVSNVYDSIMLMSLVTLAARNMYMFDETSHKTARIVGVVALGAGLSLNSIAETPATAPAAAYVHSAIKDRTLDPVIEPTTPDPGDLIYGDGASLLAAGAITGALGGFRRRQGVAIAPTDINPVEGVRSLAITIQQPTARADRL